MLYLWGKKAEGDLSRPFKTGGGLMDSLSEFLDGRCVTMP
jgi:hypothetical protein